MMLSKTKRMNRFVAASMASLVFVGLTGVAFASQGLIQDRRVTLKDAKRMLASIKADDGFQIVVNDLVLKQLNRYIGTPEGREHMRKSLARMENYRSLVEKKISDYSVPVELLAIPIVESGYQNLEQTPNTRAAGLWMFIPSTARNYGLRVDGTNDDRLNVDLETDAAMRYIVANNARFKSWELSVLAYNIGESRVQEGIDKVGSRDVWALIRSGFENDVDYFPKLMAAILIMKNPSVVE